jgi:WD40 repeat protein
VLVWDPADPGTGPAKLGHHDDWVRAAAVLADGRVVTGGSDRRVLVWDPADPGTGPAELGHHDGAVRTVAVLAGGRVVTGGNDGRVLAWDLARPGVQIDQLSCSVTCLATRPFGPVRSDFVIAHGLSGFSLWSLMG